MGHGENLDLTYGKDSLKLEKEYRRLALQTMPILFLINFLLLFHRNQ